MDVVVKNAALEKGKTNSLLKEGRTLLIIDEKEDDNMTNPAGNAGNRIAGGKWNSGKKKG